MGSVVRLEPLVETHREPLRLAAQDERIWEFNLVSGFGPAFDPWFDAALKGQAAGHRIPFVVVRQSDGCCHRQYKLSRLHTGPFASRNRLDVVRAGRLEYYRQPGV